MNTGEQHRTIICNCGFTTKGDLRTANYKIKLHNKICNLKILNDPKMPKFNSENALINGKNKLKGNNNKIAEIISK
jgi:hypothetical protein